MKTKILLLSFFISSILTGQLYAQSGFLDGVGVGVKASTYGGGIDVNVSLLPFLKARVGFNYFGYTYLIDKEVIDVEALDETKLDLTVKDAVFTLPNGNLLLDLYPIPVVPISITGGLYFGQNNVHINATTTLNKTFEYQGVELTPQNNKLSGDINMGGVVKPYLGIGLGRTVPKGRVGFRFDLGAIYQGDIVALSENVPGKSINIHEIDFSEAGEEIAVGVALLKWWPMLSFTLSCRIL